MISWAKTSRDIESGRVLLARENLVAFSKRLNVRYVPVDHHWTIADALQAVERGDERRVLLTVPPRHGKSELGSINFPPWFLGRQPDKRIISASYAAALANTFSRRARNLIGHPLYPFEITTAGDLSNVQRWDIAGHRGGYISAGVGGSIAGHGADVLLIDDPVGSAEQADSATYRERAWEWYTQDAYTRLEPGGSVVVIGTRWHEDDLIGRLLNGADRWLHIDLPAINDDGDALWSERFPVERLREIEAEIGARAFLSLYQQRPSPVEGSILKREEWRHWREPLPPFDWILQAWDTAYKTSEQNDYSVGITMGLARNGFYLLDLWRGRVPFPELKRIVRDQYDLWQPHEVAIEDAASGQSLLQEFSDARIMPGTSQTTDPLAFHRALPVVPFKPDRDKLARVNAVSPYVEGGHVYLPADATWREAFIEEAATFPNGVHDDQVDAFTIGMLRLIERANALRPVDPAIRAAWAR